MNALHIERVISELNLKSEQVENTVKLLGEGSTVPFISRYRKETTGNLDEVQITRIQDLKQHYEELEKRREFIAKTITEQDKMTEALQQRLQGCWSMNELEDLYLPFKPKRKTRAAVAIEKGLEPLAKMILNQQTADPETSATDYIQEQVPAVEDALKGARDIIAEWINEDLATRELLRHLFKNTASLTARVIEGKEAEGDRYKDYFDYEEKIGGIPSHRLLAVYRAEMEGILYASIAPDEAEAVQGMEKLWIPGSHPAAEQMRKALKDAYKRLLRPSLENEFRTALKEHADEDAITVFADNLRQLLLAAPFGPKGVIGIDPGYRTGCKTVALDAQGNLLDHTVIFPGEKNRREAAEALLKQWVKQYQSRAIAIGNGTAGRETEAFVKEISFDSTVAIFMVSESGASVYSASEVAREEFPNEDLTVRGAVSIGRRLMDPLAELVKMDPKSIGVGQYQHDVNQAQLKQSLDRVVVSCVNNVGVNLNTASKHLLGYVSGLGRSLAENIIRYRKENGPFPHREALKKIPGLGEKTFEQCAGILRIPESNNPLDNTAVHPERYGLVSRMAQAMDCQLDELIKNEQIRKQIRIKDFVGEEAGALTLRDILEELEKPGRDPRGEAVIFEYAEGIHHLEDLKPGMELPGVITNITNFGVFVDVGVKQDGLVHISHISNRYISHPSEVVKLNQKVKVKVLEVDADRKRISLSIKETMASSNDVRPPKRSAKKQASAAVIAQDDFRDKLAELKKKFT